MASYRVRLEPRPPCPMAGGDSTFDFRHRSNAFMLRTMPWHVNFELTLLMAKGFLTLSTMLLLPFAQGIVSFSLS